MTKIIYESVKGLQSLGIDDVFLKNRKVFLVGEVNDESCNELIKKLLYLEMENDTLPITLFINSPGGDVSSGLAVYDTIRLMKSPITAIVTGIAASMGAIIMLACDKNRRLILPSGKVMIHDCSFRKHDIGGKKPYEIEEELNQLKHTNDRLVKIIAECTGKTKKEVTKVTKYDSYFDAKEAVEFGLVADVITQDTVASILRKGE